VEHALITEANEGTAVGNAISVHHEAIAELEELRSHKADVGVLELRLVVKDVNSVEDEAMGIEQHRDVVLVSKGISLAKVGHGEAMASRASAGEGDENKSDRLGLREGLLHESEIDITSISADGLDVHAIVKDVSLGSGRRTIAENDGLLVRISGLHHTTNRAEDKEFSSTLLRNDEEVGARKLEEATVDEAASLRLTQLELRGPAVLINDDLLDESVDAGLVSGLGLEDVTDGVKDGKVTVVATVGLITTEESGPLDIGHGDAAAVTEEVAGEHGSGERVVVVCASAALESLETLLSSGAVVDAHDVSAVGGDGDAQLICALEFSAHCQNS